MEKRTLVKSGASSFNVSLPITWVRKNKLDKGSVVSIDENETGDLVFSVERDPFSVAPSHHTIKVTKNNVDILYWELLRAYLHNYTVINLEGKNVSSLVSSTLQNLKAFIGLDIIDQTKDVVVLKNFSAHDTETSPYVLIKKMDVGVRAMIELIQNFSSKGFSHDDVTGVLLQHEYNERLYLFALKVVNNAMDSSTIRRSFKTDYHQLMRERELLRALRKISFHYAQIGKLLLFVEHGRKAGKMLDEMFKTLYQKYRVMISMPKNPLSTDTIDVLFNSKEHVARWESKMKELKVQPLLELYIHGLNINTELDQLGLELV